MENFIIFSCNLTTDIWRVFFPPHWFCFSQSHFFFQLFSSGVTTGIICLRLTLSPPSLLCFYSQLAPCPLSRLPHISSEVFLFLGNLISDVHCPIYSLTCASKCVNTWMKPNYFVGFMCQTPVSFHLTLVLTSSFSSESSQVITALWWTIVSLIFWSQCQRFLMSLFSITVKLFMKWW